MVQLINIEVEAKNGRFRSKEELQKFMQEQYAVGTASEEEHIDFIHKFQTDYVPKTEHQEERGRIHKQLVNRTVERLKAYTDPETQERIKEYQKAGSEEGNLDRVFYPILNYYSDNPEKYQELYGIFAGNDKEAQAREYLAFWNFLKEGMDMNTLVNMSDEQIVENSAKLQNIAPMIIEFERVVGKDEDGKFVTMFPLSDERCESMLRERQQYQQLMTLLQAKLNIIAHPYYEKFPPESFRTMDFIALAEYENRLDEGLEDEEAEEKIGGFKNYLQECEGYFSMLGLYWEREIEQRELQGIPMDQMTWLDVDGKEIRKLRYDGVDLGKPDRVPTKELIQGRPLIAKFPDGTQKTFWGTMENGIPKIGQLDGRMISDHMTRKMPELSKRLKDADPWYIRSSQEFRNVRERLEKVTNELQTLGTNSTEYQREKLFKQISELEESSQKYLDVKRKSIEDSGSKANDREQRRLDAVDAIRKFAQEQKVVLQALNNQMEVQKNMSKEASIAKAFGEEAREEQQKEIERQFKKEWKFKRPATATGAIVEGKDRSRELEDLRRQFMPDIYPSVKTQSYEESDVGNCYSDFVENRVFYSLSDWINVYNINNGTTDLQKSFDLKINTFKELLAELAVVELIKREREANEFSAENSVAGPIERRLVSDPDAVNKEYSQDELVEDVMNSKEFQDMVAGLSPERLNHIILDGGVEKLAKRIEKKWGEKQREEEQREQQKWEEEYKHREQEYKENRDAIIDKIYSYSHLETPASDKGDLLQKMKFEAVYGMNRMEMYSDDGMFQVPKEIMINTMAKMVAVNLILDERGTKTENIKAGPRENALHKIGIDKFVKSIKETEIFQKEVENVSVASYNDFLLHGGSEKICQKLREKAIEIRETELAGNVNIKVEENNLDRSAGMVLN